jgi:hypothetical protein
MSGRLSGVHALQVSISKVLIFDLTREAGMVNGSRQRSRGALGREGIQQS